jgi:hypothetical protein
MIFVLFVAKHFYGNSSPIVTIKSEYRNSKQFQISKIQMTETGL